MSSNKRFARICALVLIAFSSASAQQTADPAAIGCPASISVHEAAEPVAGWSLDAGKASRAFERISIFNRDSAGKEYDLAPDDQKQLGKRITQSWNVKPYRTMAVYLRCRYRDTPVTLSRELPPAIGACTLRYIAGSHGEVAAKPEMSCH